MRTLKFRAWNKIQNRMEYGIGIAPEGFTASSSVSSNGTIINPNSPGRYEIQQYIGLTDNKGKEIYEGDIVKVGSFISDGIVVFNEEVPQFQYAYKAHGKGAILDGRMTNNFYKHRQSDYEVIGNIYENPELLINTGQKNEAKPLL